MIKIWTDDAWEDYLYWQSQDRKTLKRINQLILDIDRNGNKGIGKPEPLKHEFQGFWSRRIDDCNRIVYRIQEGRIGDYPMWKPLQRRICLIINYLHYKMSVVQ